MGEDFYQIMHLTGDRRFANFAKKYNEYDRKYYRKKLKPSNKNWKEEEKIKVFQEFKPFELFEKQVKKTAAAQPQQ